MGFFLKLFLHVLCNLLNIPHNPPVEKHCLTVMHYAVIFPQGPSMFVKPLGFKHPSNCIHLLIGVKSSVLSNYPESSYLPTYFHSEIQIYATNLHPMVLGIVKPPRS